MKKEKKQKKEKKFLVPFFLGGTLIVSEQKLSLAAVLWF